LPCTGFELACGFDGYRYATHECLVAQLFEAARTVGQQGIDIHPRVAIGHGQPRGFLVAPAMGHGYHAGPQGVIPAGLRHHFPVLVFEDQMVAISQSQ